MHGLSPNYFLYFEFFNICISVLLLVFLVEGSLYALYTIVNEYIFPLENTVSMLIIRVIFTILIGVLVRVLIRKEENTLVEYSVLNNLPWTEDMFSLLIDGISNRAKKEEIIFYFRGILNSLDVTGNIKDLIFIQDYSEHAQIKQAIKELDEQLMRKDSKQIKNSGVKLLNKKSQLAGLLGQSEAKIINFELFKGKAIIIFNNIQAKMAVLQYYNESYKRSMSNNLDKFPKQFCLNNANLVISDISAPQETYFENLHSGRCKLICAKIFLYITSLVAVLAAQIALLRIDFNELVTNNNFQSLAAAVAERMYSYEFITGSVLLDFLIQYIFSILNNKFPHATMLGCYTQAINFRIYATLLLYFPMQMIPLYVNPDIWLAQISKVSLVYSAILLIVKLLQMYFKIRTLDRQHTLSEIERSLSSGKASNGEDYNCIERILSIIPLLFTAFIAVALNYFIVLLIVMSTLYLVTLMDKYMIFKYYKLPNKRSLTYMLTTFQILRWDLFIIYAVGLSRNVVDYQMTFSKGDWNITSIILWVLTFITVVLSLVFWPISLEANVKKRFMESHSDITHEKVSERFESSYFKVNPLSKITE